MKMWNYVFVAVGLSILFELAGLFTTSGILGLIGFSLVDGAIAFNPSVAGFLDFIFNNSTGILIGVVGGIIIGAITRSSPENFIILPVITTMLVQFIQIFINIIQEALSSGQTWIAGLVALLIGPFIIGFGVAAYEHFRGTD